MAKRPTSQDRGEDRQFDQAEKVLAQHYRRILRRVGVSHVDVNYRTRRGRRTREIVIRVHVEKKLDDQQLRPNQRLTEIAGVPVDVVEGSNTYARHAGVLQGGSRIAPAHNPAATGTLGTVCFTNGSNQPRFLTNAHIVYGGEPKRRSPNRIPMLSVPGDERPTRIGDGLRSKSFHDASGDAALIHPLPDVVFLPGVKKILPNRGRLARLTRHDVRDRVRVLKMGAETGETEGIVDSITLTFSVPGFTFFGQIGIRPSEGSEPFSAAGDSGAVVCKGDTVVGLLHGATYRGKLAVACHMSTVAERLGVDF